jgi:hypothetical protein
LNFEKNSQPPGGQQNFFEVQRIGSNLKPPSPMNEEVVKKEEIKEDKIELPEFIEDKPANPITFLKADILKTLKK